MSLKKQAVSGVVWTFAQQFSVQIINLTVQIILARLLVPEDFGLIAMLTIFIEIGQMLMDGGMTTSLIRTKNPCQLDYSTVFVTNVLISIVIYLVIFLSAPFIANFYNQAILINILRVYAISFVIRSLIAVHIAKLTKEMNFKFQMQLQIPSTIIAAFVGVLMAYLGFGVWSLVGLNLTQSIVFTIQAWIFIRWKPSLLFNKEKFIYHFNFGYKMTLSGLLDVLYKNIYLIVIGKAFSSSTLGYFNQSMNLSKFPVAQISTVMDKVTYPLFTNISDDEQLKSAYRKTMLLVFLIVVPMMMILIVTGKEIFLFLLGEKWLPSVKYFQILAIVSIINPLTTYNLNILKVKGRSDLFLKLEILKKVIGFFSVFIAIPFGLDILVISYVIVSYILTAINMIYSGKLINYSFIEQIKDVSKIIIIGTACMITTFVIRSFLINYVDSYFILIVSITAIFLSLYFILIYSFENKTFKLLLSILKIKSEKNDERID